MRTLIGLIAVLAGATILGGTVGSVAFGRARRVRWGAAAAWIAVGLLLASGGLLLVPSGVRWFLLLMALIPALAGFLYAWIDYGWTGRARWPIGRGRGS